MSKFHKIFCTVLTVAATRSTYDDYATFLELCTVYGRHMHTFNTTSSEINGTTIIKFLQLAFSCHRIFSHTTNSAVASVFWVNLGQPVPVAPFVPPDSKHVVRSTGNVRQIFAGLVT